MMCLLTWVYLGLSFLLVLDLLLVVARLFACCCWFGLTVCFVYVCLILFMGVGFLICLFDRVVGVELLFSLWIWFVIMVLFGYCEECVLGCLFASLI